MKIQENTLLLQPAVLRAGKLGAGNGPAGQYTFKIPKQQMDYLNGLSSLSGVNIGEYLRRLVRQDMTRNIAVNCSA